MQCNLEKPYLDRISFPGEGTVIQFVCIMAVN